MIGLIATLVFTIAGGTSAAVIGTSVRTALPTIRRLAAERRTLAEDRVYLFTLIETPRHGGAPLRQAITLQPAVAAARKAGVNPLWRRGPTAPVPLRAAA